MVKISELVNQNPWWKHGNRFTHFDVKLIDAKRQPVFFERKTIPLHQGNIYLLRGPRQVGKTTYIKDLISKLIKEGINPNTILYLSADFFVSRRELRNAINYFMNKNIDASSVHIFIDEITSLEDWNLELKYLSDSGIVEKGKILVTGSCASTLKTKGEMLPGRGLEGNEYHMSPLSFRDFVLETGDYIRGTIDEREFRDSLSELQSTLRKTSVVFGQTTKQQFVRALYSVAPFKRELSYFFNIYLRCGGYPFAVNNYISQKSQSDRFSIDSRFAEILIRDIVGDLSKLGKQETIIRQILRETSERIGSRYSFSKLAEQIESTHVTVIDYLEALEESFILIVLYAIDFNKKEPKFKGSKKIVFRDPFIFHSIRSFLTGKDVNEIIEETLQNEELAARIVEGIVSSHLVTSLEIPMIKEPKTFLWFYYNERGKEIDNILRVDDSYLAIEVKYQNNVTTRDIWKIPHCEQFLIITKEDFKPEGNVILVPAEMFLALLERSKHVL
jgi:hypothetical protein